MAEIITIKGFGQAELVERKSTFIGYAESVCDEGAAQQFIRQIRAKHPDASHNVYAYQCGEHDEIQRASDAGEPAGTAGRPILEVIKQQKLKNSIIVVTRYFGGILLGAGGLVRAYSKTASLAIVAAGKKCLVEAYAYAITVNYAQLARLESWLSNNKFLIEEKVFTDVVSLQCLIPQTAKHSFLAGLAELMAGSAAVIPLGGEHWLESDMTE